jgi:copper chaperone
MSERTFAIPTVACGHYVTAITGSVCAVPGVAAVAVESRTVRVPGTADPDQLRPALSEAGHDAV